MYFYLNCVRRSTLTVIVVAFKCFSPDTCPPGYTSSNSFYPCTRCPEDTHSVNSTTCMACPNQGSTLGSTGVSDAGRCYGIFVLLKFNGKQLVTYWLNFAELGCYYVFETED